MLADPGYKFCPKCGAGFEKRKLKEFEPERLVCPKCGFVFFLNPKIAAGAVVEYDGRLVLLRRAIEPRAGFWVHPGGFVDRGETLEAAAIRETREEVGMEVAVTRLLGAFSFADSEVVVVTFATRTISGRPIVGDECAEVATFALHEIPWNDLAFPSTRLALEEYVRLQSPTTFTGENVRQALRKRQRAPAQSLEARIKALEEARVVAHDNRDVRAACVVYPSLISALREGRRFKEALVLAEEGLALTHDPMLAMLADEVAHDLAEAEAERC